jgi:hypothetical protein
VVKTPCVTLCAPNGTLGIAAPVTVLLVDRNPVSESVHAKAHGRVEALLRGYQCLLVVLAAWSGEGALPTPVFVLCLVITSCLHLYSLVVYQPLYRLWWAQGQCALASLFVWASGCTLLAEERNVPEDEVCSLCCHFNDQSHSCILSTWHALYIVLHGAVAGAGAPPLCHPSPPSSSSSARSP